MWGLRVWLAFSMSHSLFTLQSPCPSRGRAEGAGASGLLPNHHHPPGPRGGLFEDFAC